MATDTTQVRILIADDHPIFREGLRRLLETEPRFDIVGEAADGEEAVELLRRLRPDILLLDLRMERMDGLAVLRAMAGEGHATKVVILTAAIERADMVTAVQLGARGVLMKDAATPLLYKCIDRVMAGEYWLGRDTVGDLVAALQAPAAQPAPAPRIGLTPRERDIVKAVVDGASNKDIAAQFGVSPQTVKNHLSVIFDKLGVSSRLELALYAMHHKVLRDEHQRP
jgi:two-component system, NarL family, nitrate/nitrite response regulator NarL